MLLISIIHLLNVLFHIPTAVLFVLTLILFSIFAGIAVIGVLLLIRNYHKKDYTICFLCILLSVYAFALCWKTTYYFSFQKTVVKPELVDVIQTSKSESGIVQTYFTIKRYPFELQSIFNGNIHSFSKDITDSTIRDQIDTEYTYIVSYGRKIDQISYFAWDGYDYLPPPWNGIIMRPEFSFASKGDYCVYIYRISLVAIECEH